MSPECNHTHWALNSKSKALVLLFTIKSPTGQSLPFTETRRGTILTWLVKGKAPRGNLLLETPVKADCSLVWHTDLLLVSPSDILEIQTQMASTPKMSSLDLMTVKAKKGKGTQQEMTGTPPLVHGFAFPGFSYPRNNRGPKILSRKFQK